MQEISFFNLFIRLRYSQFYSPVTRLVTPIFDHALPQKTFDQLLIFVNLFNMQSLSHLFILQIQSILESFHLLICMNLYQHVKIIRIQRPDWPYPYFDHVQPKYFRTTFKFCEFVSTCKKSGCFMNFFWRNS